MKSFSSLFGKSPYIVNILRSTYCALHITYKKNPIDSFFFRRLLAWRLNDTNEQLKAILSTTTHLIIHMLSAA